MLQISEHEGSMLVGPAPGFWMVGMVLVTWELMLFQGMGVGFKGNVMSNYFWGVK